MTNIDDGKKVYVSYAEAEKVAAKMSRTHNEGFKVYKVGSQWAVGGVHTKTEKKGNKSSVRLTPSGYCLTASGSRKKTRQLMTTFLQLKANHLLRKVQQRAKPMTGFLTMFL